MNQRPTFSMTRQGFEKAITELIEETSRSQIEIARALGYRNANIITMFKNGSTRIPGGKVVPLALALGQDPGVMLRQWLVAYMPEMFPDIEKYLMPDID